MNRILYVKLRHAAASAAAKSLSSARLCATEV